MMQRYKNLKHSRIRQIHKTYRNLRRTRQILAVFLKYGFDDILERIKVEYVFRFKQRFQRRRIKEEITQVHPAERLRLAFGELGPTFIKLGQIMSTRPDVIPPRYVKEFEKLRDRAAPLPIEAIKHQVEKNFSKPLLDLFKEFGSEPIASASISQVHFAKLHSGEEVAVKIQRPNIRQIVDSDISVLRDLAALITRHLPEVALYNPVGIVEEFNQSIHQEMDFVREGRNIERFERNFKDNDFVVVPKVHWEYTTTQILTADLIEGTNFSELIDKPLDPETNEKFISNAADVMLKQIFEYGFFHADPHPSNILLLPGIRLALLDFGMMGYLEDQLRENIGELLYGIVKKDIPIVLRELQTITDIPEEVDMRHLRMDISDFIDRYHNLPISKINFEHLLNELFDISRRHKIAFPSDLVMMFRALIISESIVRSISPGFNFVEKAEPMVRKLFLHKYDPLRKMKQLLAFLEDSEDLIRSFPNEIKAIMQKIKQGEMTVKFQHQNLEDLISELELTSSRLSFSLIIAAIIIGSSLIIHSNKGILLFGIPLFGLIGFVLAGIMGLGLAISIWRSGRLR